MDGTALRRGAGAIAAAALLGGGIFIWSRPSSHRGAAFAAPAEAGRPIPTGDAPAPLVALVSDVTPADREARRFNRYDKDRDSAITRDEYFVSRRKAFARLDLDGDGKLSFDEYNARAAKKFATADASRDGKLSAAEFATTAVKRRPRAVNCPPGEVAQPDAQPDEG